ncbi:hypothetical protein D9615_010095 [Tricholomella constricta]|uniref:AB hydrolase-1 domain-containing protein n=1 Tax=Tricholomella constricta TaxID=117010 RepID=A0A8H5GXB2_9AGAR|nr:hypothetical protein D9615_010095 [Tricholomella constricta]
MTELVELPSGICLEVHLATPTLPGGEKLTICLHPWSWLGGQMDDPVLLCLVDELQENHYVLRYNSRGVGASTGWTSFTGLSEAKDLEDLAIWALQRLSSIKSLVIIGYSHGSLIASLHPILPTIKTSHVLISYPLGPRGWLTLFHTGTYSARLKELIQNVDSNVLIIYGDRDEFTGVSKYRGWRQSLEEESGGQLRIVEIERASHFWRGHADPDAGQHILFYTHFILSTPLTSFLFQILFSKQMPLPDERPRQSVANLIGRFENQVKRQPSSSPGSVRSSSVVSHTTGDSAKEEVKEKREWPPKSLATDGRPPPIVPSSSWSRSQATASQSLPPPKPVPAATQGDVEDSALTPRPNSTTSMDNTRITSPQRELSVGVTAPTPTSSNTPTTAKPPTKPPLKASKPPPSDAPKTPARTGRPSTHFPLTALPIKPQHTAPASASTSARKVVPKSTPMTPVRAKTPSRTTPATSRPKTPTSIRSKTPSSGLFAPTAASLARARNAQPLPPTPTKKVILSSSAAERLSKPTAASLSKARSPTVVPARGGAKPPVRGISATRGSAKPRVSTASASTGMKEEQLAAREAVVAATATATAAGGGLAAAAVEPEHVADEAEAAPEENGYSTKSIKPTADDSQDTTHADRLAENEAQLDMSQSTEGLAKEASEFFFQHSDADTVEAVDDEVVATKSPEPISELESHDLSLDPLEEVEATPAIDERVDEVKSRLQVGDEIEDMVSLLETVSISTVRPESIASIPDEVSEIPDEE